MSKRRSCFISLIMILFLGSSSAIAQQKKDLPFPVTQFTLRNGLQVILSEDYSLPLVSIVIAYYVGSINEKPGKTGLAYLMENLMFQGSKNIGQMQHINFIHRIGGELNATTTEDKTMFYQTVPSNQLALVLWLESDRMKSLEIFTSKVERAKVALIEEIRHRKTSDHYLESSLYFDRLLFPDFAYNHPVIGDEADLREITIGDVKNFYSTYYAPNNAVLCISGNIDKRKTIQLIRRYFEKIPQGKKTPPLALPEVLETKSTNITIENSLASSPAFRLGYRICSPYTEDYYALSILEYVLLRGQTSRLYRRLIKKDRIALDLSGGIEKKFDLAAFKIFVINNNEILKERSQKAIFSEINKIKSNLISEKELIKSKNMFKMDYIKQFATSLDKAIFLTEVFLTRKSLDDIPEDLDRFLSITRYDVTRIINKYLGEEKILINIKIK